MTAQVEDVFLDGGLTAAKAAISHIYICASEPTTVAIAVSTYLGFKSWGAANAFAAPAAGTSPTGRKLTSVAITDGTITTTGTASWWAAVAGSTSLYAHGLLSSSQAVTAGNTFSLGAFDIKLANQ